MNEILADTKTVLLWLFGVIGTLLGILGAVALSILRGHIKRIDNLEKEAVRRAEFEELRKDFQDKHAENGEKFDELKDLLERQNELAALHRTLVGDSLATIRTHVAVIRDRMGDDPLKDSTGKYRRSEG